MVEASLGGLRQIRMMRTIRPTSSAAAAALVPRQRSNQLHSRAFLFFWFRVVVIVRLCQVAALGLNRDRTHRDLFPLLRRKPRLQRLDLVEQRARALPEYYGHAIVR